MKRLLTVLAVAVSLSACNNPVPVVPPTEDPVPRPTPTRPSPTRPSPVPTTTTEPNPPEPTATHGPSSTTQS